jgi:folate-binding protein YgfZ
MTRRDLVRVSGPDTWTFLQSLLSQDLDGMSDGDRQATLLLTPQGKVDVVGEISRSGDDALIETEPGWGEQLVASLARFKIRTKVEFAVEPAPTVGPEGFAVEEAERIAAGIPRMGADLDGSVIPQEAFLEQNAVSFTKGCFIGQELVCRIDSRGHVNRFLRHLVPEDSSRTLAVGAEITVDGKVVGSVTSAAPGIAMGFVRREVDPPASASVDGVAVRVEVIAQSME